MDLIFFILWPALFIILFAAAVVGLAFLITYIVKYSALKTDHYRNCLIATIIVFSIVMLLLTLSTWHFIDILKSFDHFLDGPNKKSTTESAQQVLMYLGLFTKKVVIIR